MPRWPQGEDEPQDVTAGEAPDDGTAIPGPPSTDWEVTSHTAPQEKTSAATAPAFQDQPVDDAPDTSLTRPTLPASSLPVTPSGPSQPVGSAGSWGTLDASGQPVPGQVLFN